MTDKGGRAGTDLQKWHPQGLSTSFQPGLVVSLFILPANSYSPAPAQPENSSQIQPWASTLWGFPNPSRGFEVGRALVQRCTAPARLWGLPLPNKSPFGPAVKCLFTTPECPNAFVSVHFLLWCIYHLAQGRRRPLQMPPKTGGKAFAPPSKDQHHRALPAPMGVPGEGMLWAALTGTSPMGWLQRTETDHGTGGERAWPCISPRDRTSPCTSVGSQVWSSARAEQPQLACSPSLLLSPKFHHIKQLNCIIQGVSNWF